jgi:hypothetical protein
MWQDPRLRDFWGLVMDYVHWHDFLRLRALCTMFYKKSMDNQCHWYFWLEHWGKPGGFRYNLATHVLPHCKAHERNELCKDHRHYRGIEKIPRILKTVPLSKQVLSQCAKRHQRELNAIMGKAMVERDKFELLVLAYRREMDDCKHKLLLADALVAKHASKRKRTHIEINISNLGDN